MRVVHVYKDIFPVMGGIENHVRLLCRELAGQQGIEPHILVTDPGRGSGIDRLDGVPVLRAGRLATVASTPISPRLALELRRLRPDLVHLHVPYPIGELAYLLATPRVPVVVTYHSDVVRQRGLLRLYAPVLRALLARADRILVTSPQYRDSSPWLGAARARCTVLPLGIDLEPFQRRSPTGDGRTLLFVGRFRYYKGLPYLLEALARLPEARLILVGGGGEEQALRAQAAQLDLGDRLIFAGHVPDAELPAYYARADLYVLPASERSEAFGLSLVEAMAGGLPCVSTELGTGTSYVNLAGTTGLVVPPRDPRALAVACDTLLRDAGMRAAMGRAARLRAAELFDIRRVARSVAEVYREVLAARGRPA